MASLASRFSHLSNTSAVYVLTHNEIVIYCGGTTKLRNRIYMHFYSLMRGAHKSKAVQNLYDSIDDKEKFQYKAVEYCDADKVFERERYWTAQYTGLLNSIPAGGKFHSDLLALKSELAKKQMSDPEHLAAATARCLENSKKVAEMARNDPKRAEERLVNALKASEAVRLKLQDVDALKEHSDGLRKRWSDPAYKERLSKSLQAAWDKKKATYGT